MKVIYKYILTTTDTQTVAMPKNAQILTVQTQNEKPCLWAILDMDEQREETKDIEIFGTGHPIEDSMTILRNYIGTYQLNNGQLVFHVFERLDK